MECADNVHIPRVPDAGEIRENTQIMHNGLRVMIGSYYGHGPVELLRKNRGVHEPQEERVFQEVLKTLHPRSVMLELGAYWGFYSMWFCKEVPDARVYLVEPEVQNLDFGKKNFALNSLTGSFIQAAIGRSSATDVNGVRTVSIDDLVCEHKIDKIAILHSDIQGAELDMLQGAAETLDRIDWFFISTHSDSIHRACEQFLSNRALVPVASVMPSESYSLDGILVCRSPRTEPIPPLKLSRRDVR